MASFMKPYKSPIEIWARWSLLLSSESIFSIPRFAISTRSLYAFMQPISSVELSGPDDANAFTAGRHPMDGMLTIKNFLAPSLYRSCHIHTTLKKSCFWNVLIRNWPWLVSFVFMVICNLLLTCTALDMANVTSGTILSFTVDGGWPSVKRLKAMSLMPMKIIYSPSWNDLTGGRWEGPACHYNKLHVCLDLSYRNNSVWIKCALVQS